MAKQPRLTASDAERILLNPGHFLRQLVDEHGITQTRLAKHLGVQIGVINQICTEKRGISPAMAFELSAALGTSPEFWLNRQTAYELGRKKKPRRVIGLLLQSVQCD